MPVLGGVRPKCLNGESDGMRDKPWHLQFLFKGWFGCPLVKSGISSPPSGLVFDYYGV